jgi:hypothetical protein
MCGEIERERERERERDRERERERDFKIAHVIVDVWQVQNVVR